MSRRLFHSFTSAHVQADAYSGAGHVLLGFVTLSSLVLARGCYSPEAGSPDETFPLLGTVVKICHDSVFDQLLLS